VSEVDDCDRVGRDVSRRCLLYRQGDMFFGEEVVTANVLATVKFYFKFPHEQQCVYRSVCADVRSYRRHKDYDWDRCRTRAERGKPDDLT